MTEEDKIIGEHPTNPNIFGDWLSATDNNEINKKHRKLNEINSYKIIVGIIAQWIVKHHVKEEDINSLRNKKRRIQKKYGFEKYIDSSAYLPEDDNTRKGNGAEIIFSEYLYSTLKKKPFFFKLRYNPNTSQSMKGDDILILDKKNLKEGVILGEVKFRVPATRGTVNEILSTIGGNAKLPLSLTFISGIAREKKQTKLANAIQDLQVEMKDGKIPIKNVGLIMSDGKAHDCVTNHHLFADFTINNDVIRELSNNSFPLDISPLLGFTFRTEDALFSELRNRLEADGLKRNLLNKKNKRIVFEHSDKTLNPNMLFVTLASAEANHIIDESFDLAKKILRDIKDEEGNFVVEMIDAILAKLIR